MSIDTELSYRNAIWPNEEMLWANQCLYPESAAYQVSFGVKVQGILLINDIQNAVNAIVSKDDILRTNYLTERGRIVPVIRANIFVEVKVNNYSSLDEKSSIIQSICLKPFKLPTDQLIRINAFTPSRRGGRNNSADYVLFTFHHAIFDSESVGVFVDRLVSILSTANQNGITLSADNMNLFSNYVNNNSVHIISDSDNTYWSALLQNVKPFVELPFYRCPNDERRFRGFQIISKLPNHLVSKIECIEKRYEIEFSVVCFSSIFILLYKYFGSGDIAVLTPFDKDRPNNMIGFPGTILPVYCVVNIQDTLCDIESSIRASLKYNNERSNVPYNEIVKILRSITGKVAEAPFQVMFEYHEVKQKYFVDKETILTLDFPETGLARLPLSLNIMRDEEEVLLIWEYNKHVFDDLTARELAEAYLEIISHLVEYPDDEIGKYHLPQPIKRVNYPKFVSSDKLFKEIDLKIESISSRFKHMVDKYPNKNSVELGIESITYRELDILSDGVAFSLLYEYKKNIGSYVGLYFTHSIEYVIAVLACVKAGIVYIPLDVYTPVHKNIEIINDTNVNLIITNQDDIEDLSYKCIAYHLSLDSIRRDVEFSTVALGEYTPIYMIYTSGTSGKPKGVVQLRRNLLHHVSAWTETLKISVRDRCSLISSLSWDSAVQDIFGTILNGACLCIADPKQLGLRKLAEWIVEESLTVMHMTIPLFRNIINNLTREDTNTIRIVAVGGDLAISSDLDNFKRIFSKDAYLVNLYGTTESSSALYYVANYETASVNEILPIGYPAPRTKVFIQKNGIRQRAHSIVGEIVIESEYITSVHWSRDRTSTEKERYIVLDNGRTQYLTGDLGRVLEDGAIEYVGRNDSLLKVRGFRVSLGEISSYVKRHPDILQVYVVGDAENFQETEIIAYVTLRKGVEGMSIAELREFMLPLSPDYMVPKFLVILPEIPLTIRGKINYKQLPFPETSGLVATNSDRFVEPRDDIEASVVTIWAERLEIDKVSINSNFFTIGGHSLIGFLIIDDIYKKYNIELSPTQFYRESSTPERMANKIRGLLNGTV